MFLRSANWELWNNGVPIAVCRYQGFVSGLAIVFSKLSLQRCQGEKKLLLARCEISVAARATKMCVCVCKRETRGGDRERGLGTCAWMKISRKLFYTWSLCFKREADFNEGFLRNKNDQSNASCRILCDELAQLKHKFRLANTSPELGKLFFWINATQVSTYCPAFKTKNAS